MRKPYFLERHRIAKNQSDRRDAIEKEMYERGHSINYEEVKEGAGNEFKNTQDVAGA